MRFVPRHPDLLKIEGNYGEFVFSCRHRDILRCSVSRHFRSCYSPDGINSHIPRMACSNPDVAMVFERDRSGQFIWRAFVKRIDIFKPELLVGKFYGNNYDDKKKYILEKLPDSILVDQDLLAM